MGRSQREQAAAVSGDQVLERAQDKETAFLWPALAWPRKWGSSGVFATCARDAVAHLQPRTAAAAIIRTVTLKQFVEDQYRNIAQLVVSPDDSVLSSFVVYPGLDQTITIAAPAKGAVAVYFLFTGATGTSWKQLFDSPPSTIHIDLGDNQIVTPTTTPAAGKRAPGS